MKKIVSVIAMLALLAGSLSLVGCDGSGSSSGSAGELNVFIWTEYMPDDVFKDFEDETGIRVNVSTYSSNEEMLAKVKASNEGIYDIVVPTDYMVSMMMAEGLLMEIDHSKVGNLPNISSEFMNLSFDPGNRYSVPYMGGAAALVVNTAMVDEEITSFAQLLDPKYANSIVALDDFRAVIGMCAKSLGFSLNTTDDAELALVEEALMQLKPNIRALDSDSPKSIMLNRETSIGFAWNAEIAICIDEDDDFIAVFPSEGCYLFLDSFCITRGAKNADAAHQFIDYVLRPEVSMLVSEEFPYLNPNAAAVAMLPDSYKNNPAANIDPAIIAAGEYVLDIGSAVEKYDIMWTKFVS